jgi:phage baseplate assembly protein W
METISDLQNKTYVKGLGVKVLTEPMITNTDVINASLKRILSSYFGSRIFNITFGSSATSLLFETVSDNILNYEFTQKIVEEILRFEYRINLTENDITLKSDLNNHLVILNIAYSIKDTLIKGQFRTGIKV